MHDDLGVGALGFKETQLEKRVWQRPTFAVWQRPTFALRLVMAGHR